MYRGIMTIGIVFTVGILIGSLGIVISQSLNDRQDAIDEKSARQAGYTLNDIKYEAIGTELDEFDRHRIIVCWESSYVSNSETYEIGDCLKFDENVTKATVKTHITGDANAKAQKELDNLVIRYPTNRTDLDETFKP